MTEAEKWDKLNALAFEHNAAPRPRGWYDGRLAIMQVADGGLRLMVGANVVAEVSAIERAQRSKDQIIDLLDERMAAFEKAHPSLTKRKQQ